MTDKYLSVVIGRAGLDKGKIAVRGCDSAGNRFLYWMFKKEALDLGRTLICSAELSSELDKENEKE